MKHAATPPVNRSFLSTLFPDWLLQNKPEPPSKYLETRSSCSLSQIWTITYKMLRRVKHSLDKVCCIELYFEASTKPSKGTTRFYSAQPTHINYNPEEPITIQILSAAHLSNLICTFNFSILTFFFNFSFGSYSSVFPKEGFQRKRTKRMHYLHQVFSVPFFPFEGKVICVSLPFSKVTSQKLRKNAKSWLLLLSRWESNQEVLYLPENSDSWQ